MISTANKPVTYPIEMCIPTSDILERIPKWPGAQAANTSFKLLESDEPVLRWHCQSCGRGPYDNIHECEHCKIRWCRECSFKIYQRRQQQERRGITQSWVGGKIVIDKVALSIVKS